MANETVVQQKDLKRCLICGSKIPRGTDPAVCSDRCMDAYEYEQAYMKFHAEKAKKCQKLQKP